MKNARYELLIFYFFIVIFLFRIATIDISPVIWMDEIQIIDQGRTIKNEGHTNWSMSWLPNENKPLFKISFLGPLLQEYLFEKFLYDTKATRVFSLIYCYFAACAIYCWLQTHGIYKKSAALWSIVFVLDPLISESYRGDRVDCLAIGFFLLSDIYLKKSAFTSSKLFSGCLSIISGLFGSISVIAWPSAVIMYPLYLTGLKIRKSNPDNSLPINRASFAIIFIASFIAFFLLIELPLNPSLIESGKNLFFMIKTESITDEPERLLDKLNIFIKTAAHDPALFLLASAGALIKRRPGPIFALIAGLLMIFITNPYQHRMLYIVPVLILISATCTSPKILRCRKYFLCLLLPGLAFNLGWSLKAIYEKNSRSEIVLNNLAEIIIGKGNHNVYLEAWSLYPYGRKNGWRMYNFYNIKNISDYSIDSMDFFVSEDIAIPSRLHKDYPVRQMLFYNYKPTRTECSGYLKNYFVIDIKKKQSYKIVLCDPQT